MAKTETEQVPQDEQFLSADEILSFNDVDTITVRVPEWGNRPVCFVAMSGDDAVAFNRNFKNEETKDDAVVRLFALSAVNNPTERKRIFSEAKVEQLRKHKFAIFLRLQDKLMEFNGFGDKAKASAKNA